MNPEIILAIDPGNERSGWATWNVDEQKLTACGNDTNEDVRKIVGTAFYNVCVIERPEVIGQSNIQQEVLDTAVWVGRFAERASTGNAGCHVGARVHLLTRRLVKSVITGYQNIPSADSQIIRHLTERFGKKGTKKKPGKLYGISKHAWQALAVGIAFDDIRRGNFGRTTDSIKLQIEALLKESA